ncbi:hypothetical protein AWB81_07807 [Caballeronia arationis]|uniref:DUF6723 family protein n=1 Tax=Caballeronia arationis TaxID=1777142 RepID=UPI00074CE8F6|nr:DUF6723 family protein [Caballeronia arationis]SAL06886.1 hypothetical protein AWB81_07807 [Caballeronia arationis]
MPPTPGATEADFHIYASYRGSKTTGFLGTLKVVRATDGRLLYPFDGASEMGPFQTKEEAIAAARRCGGEIVSADLARPEL